MKQLLLDRLGEWNPQLFRELKGRLTVRNVAITIGTSLLSQLLVILFWLNRLPKHSYAYQYQIWEKYCRLRPLHEAAQRQWPQLQQQYAQLQTQFARYSSPQNYDPVKIQQLKDQIAQVKAKQADIQSLLGSQACPTTAIDFDLWWHDYYSQVFVSLSMFTLFTLLVVGAFMLINDLAQEERRGTLNFIRLTPQSSQSILTGKLLGVPVLLYLGVILTLPLSVGLGFAAQISVIEIFGFWTVVVAACAFFYSAALLLGLVSSWLNGFQAWLGSGAVFIFLFAANLRGLEKTPTDWLNLFNPSVLLPYLVNRAGSSYTEFPFFHGAIEKLQWFYLPLGAMGVSVFAFALLNYGLWTYWIGQALKRRFRNPNVTMLSKQQSYLLVACSTVITLGFAWQSPRNGLSSQFFFNFHALLTINLLLFLALIAALSPHRQVLQDWARYRHTKIYSLVQDLIWGEKSPAIGAIAINLLITFVPIAGWIFLWPVEFDLKLQAFSSLILTLTVILFYATVAQLMLLMKTNKRAIWAVGLVMAISFFPPVILTGLSIYPTQNGGSLWLLTSFPWRAVEYVSFTRLLQVLGIQWAALGLLNLQLTRQLGKAGESATKVLLAGRSSR